jgi:cell division protein FtsB
VSEEEKVRSRVPLYVGVIILAMAVSFYFFILPLVTKKAAFRARVEELRKDIAAAQETNQKLQRERQMLEENDPAYLEKYARDNFGWAREGEIIYKLERAK